VSDEVEEMRVMKTKMALRLPRKTLKKFVRG
jgi:hypothetical protein